jgi:predicted SAM-dependent methyltransferase
VKIRMPSRAGVTRRLAGTADDARRGFVRARARARLRATLPPHAKVQLGCGERHLPGWVNIDVDPRTRPDLRIDLRGGFPAPRGSVSFIFSEHVFEHLELADGLRVFGDCYEALEPGGVMRVAMPDLKYIVDRYVEGRYEDEGGEVARADPAFLAIDSPARLLNHALRSWGHVYLYDCDELILRMRQAGFGKVEPVELQESEHPDLRGLEHRAESRLVVEATK